MNPSPSSYMALAAFFYSLQYLDVKTMSGTVGIWTIILTRGLGSLILTLFFILYTRPISPFGEKKRLLLIRGVLGGATISLSFLAVKNLNLSVATVIVSTSPILTGLMSCSTWTRTDLVSTAICFTGLVILSIQGITEEVHHFWIGFIAALGSSFLSALVNITIRDIRDENTLVITLYAMSACVLMTTPAAIHEVVVNGLPILDAVHATQLCLTGVASFSAQWLKTRSIQLSETLSVVVLRYLDVLFCLAWDLLLLHSYIPFYHYIGITLIFFGCLLQVTQDDGRAAPESDQSDAPAL